MIALIQRVKNASVEVEGEQVASIEQGLLAFIGVEKTDTEENIARLYDKIRKFRVFADEAGKMNLSLEDTSNELLLVPQFTLPANTAKGNRPGFDPVAPSDIGETYFKALLEYFKNNDKIAVQSGVFQADMAVSLINDGPVTFWLQK